LKAALSRTFRATADRSIASTTFYRWWAGLDIWDNADEFHFAYARLDDDGSITTRIGSVEYVHQWAKAGVMIRNALDPASQHGIAFISPLGRVSFQWRDTEAGITRHLGSYDDRVMLPHWVRLTRERNRFTAQHSSDGVNWLTIVNPQDPNEPTLVEIPMNETVYVGLAVTSHNPTRAAEARMSNVTVTGSVTPSGPFSFSQDISY
jgi:hypothetical protein